MRTLSYIPIVLAETLRVEGLFRCFWPRLQRPAFTIWLNFYPRDRTRKPPCASHERGRIRYRPEIHLNGTQARDSPNLPHPCGSSSFTSPLDSTHPDGARPNSTPARRGLEPPPAAVTCHFHRSPGPNKIGNMYGGMCRGPLL